MKHTIKFRHIACAAIWYVTQNLVAGIGVDLDSKPEFCEPYLYNHCSLASASVRQLARLFLAFGEVNYVVIMV